MSTQKVLESVDVVLAETASVAMQVRACILAGRNHQYHLPPPRLQLLLSTPFSQAEFDSVQTAKAWLISVMMRSRRLLQYDHDHDLRFGVTTMATSGSVAHAPVRQHDNDIVKPRVRGSPEKWNDRLSLHASELSDHSDLETR
jgi:hypothetical protein